MKLASLIRKRSREAVATAIPAIPATDPGNGASTVARIATVAVAKPCEGGAGDPAPATRASGWVLHFLDRQPTEMWFSPAVTHDEALTGYPGALAAEPIHERTDPRTATLIERDELLALIQAIYAGDTDADRQEAIDAALADPESALTCYRAIAAERGVSVSAAQVSGPVSAQTAVVGCKTCRHRKRPGLSAGYCGGGRDDLPGAYGEHHPLRQLPDDQGVSCASYMPHEGANHA